MNWIQEWKTFFEGVHDALGMVLEATGCREGWLQAEAYRFFRKRQVAFYTNTYPLPGSSGTNHRKADFAAYTSDANDAIATFIGELKVYGEHGYYSRNLTGGSLLAVQERIRPGRQLVFKDCSQDRALVVGSGLLADYFRLVDLKPEEGSPTRLLILCVKKTDKPDAFGEILSKIEFERPGELLVDGKHAWVKAWTVGGKG